MTNTLRVGSLHPVGLPPSYCGTAGRVGMLDRCQRQKQPRTEKVGSETEADQGRTVLSWLAPTHAADPTRQGEIARGPAWDLVRGRGRRSGGHRDQWRVGLGWGDMMGGMKGWMKGWMTSSNHNCWSNNQCNLIRVLWLELWGLRDKDDSDKDQRSKVCCKTPKIQEITVRYIIPVIYLIV